MLAALWRRLVNGFRRLLGLRLPPVPDEPAVIRPIGVIRNGVREPRPLDWESVRSDIIIRDDLAPALDGIEGFSHLIVVFSLDRVPESERRLRLAPGGDSRVAEQGVFATRSQLRPSGLGVSVVPLLRRRRTVLRVRGLDAVNGTPVLDIKPYLPPYDAVPDASMPAWARGAPTS